MAGRVEDPWTFGVQVMNKGYELIKKYRQEGRWDFEETLCVLVDFIFDARLDAVFHLTTFNMVEKVHERKGKLKDFLAYDSPVDHILEFKELMGWNKTRLLRFLGKFVARNRKLNRLDQYLCIEAS